MRVEPETPDERALGEGLDALLRQLALMIVRDGEGARRIARVVVTGGHELHLQGAARAIANSPLVKAALHGGDPNWGRIVQAVGAALPGTAPLPVDIAIEGVEVCSAGASVAYDGPPPPPRRGGAAGGARGGLYVVGLPGGVKTKTYTHFFSLPGCIAFVTRSPCGRSRSPPSRPRDDRAAAGG